MMSDKLVIFSKYTFCHMFVTCLFLWCFFFTEKTGVLLEVHFLVFTFLFLSSFLVVFGLSQPKKMFCGDDVFNLPLFEDHVTNSKNSIKL